MKTSAIKMIKSYFNKKNINNLKKFTNITNLVIIAAVISISLVSYYLLKPIFFDYIENKEVIEKKISNYLKIQTNIKGDISYYIFPSPKIVVENLELNFLESNNKPVIIKKSNFLISLSNLKSLNGIEIRKALIKNQKVKIFAPQFKNYLNYFEKNNVDNLSLKNCEIFFQDDQDNEISIKDFNLRNTFKKEKEKISIEGIFAENKFEISFLNERGMEKFLDFSLPALNAKLKIVFDKDSNLKKTSGKLNLKILNNILLLNFDGDNIYKISDSFFRNKFLNSKLDGKINFKNNFYFDLNLNINQANFKKLFLYLDSFKDRTSSGLFNLSKKINGEMTVNLNRTETFIGKIDETKFSILFENGDLKVKRGSINLEKNGKINFNISLIGRGKDQRINFFINFLSNNGKRLLKRFNLNTNEENISFTTAGKINVLEKKIKFNNLVLNKEGLEGKNLNIVEDTFNKYIMEDDVLGFLDFFKIKQFVVEVFKNLE